MPEPADQSPLLSLETSRLQGELSELNRLSASFGNTLSRAFASAIIDGRKLSDVLRQLALSLANQTLTAALKPLGGLLGGITPFADGGVVNSPLLFPFRGGTGLMGEAGPEAIMPLTRGADGKLGVKGMGGGASVTVNIVTPDLQGFQRSQSQVAAVMLRALERGRRNL